MKTPSELPDVKAEDRNDDETDDEKRNGDGTGEDGEDEDRVTEQVRGD